MSEVFLLAHDECEPILDHVRLLWDNRSRITRLNHPNRSDQQGKTIVPISVDCECGRKFKVKSEAAGLMVRCPGCQETVVVPAADEEFLSSVDGDYDDEIAPKPRQRSKQKTQKRRGSNLPMLLGIGIGAAVVLGLGAFFILHRGSQDVTGNTGAPTATTPVVSSQVSAPSVVSSPVESNSSEAPDPTLYGGPFPDGMILSPTLIRELDLMAREMELRFSKAAAKTSVPIPANEYRAQAQTLVQELRSNYPKMFCLTPDKEAQLARGEGDRHAEQRRYDEFYSLLLKRELEHPEIVAEHHEEVKRGNASVPRLIILTTVIGAQLLKDEESSGNQ